MDYEPDLSSLGGEWNAHDSIAKSDEESVAPSLAFSQSEPSPEVIGINISNSLITLQLFLSIIRHKSVSHNISTALLSTLQTFHSIFVPRGKLEYSEMCPQKILPKTLRLTFL